MDGTFIKRSITTRAAKAMIDDATEKAKELGLEVAVTIVDESGVLKSFLRMDGAPLMAVDVSKRKALTAVGLGLPTGQQWYDFIKDDPIMSEGVSGIPDFILLGGGLPISQDGAVIGAIGVSGGHYLQDEVCARSALEVLDRES
jgi:uncharacterized protein GlcG (DUF336 family)